MLMFIGLFVLQSGQLKEVDPTWLNKARGSFQLAASNIHTAIANTDVKNDKEACRILNNRMMRVGRIL